jgi:hypothetical protein
VCVWGGGGFEGSVQVLQITITHIADSCPIIEEDVRKQFVSTMKKQPLEGSFVFDPQVSRE